MKKLLVIVSLLVNCGCATLFAGTGLEMSTTLLTLGGMGQTLINMTAADAGTMKVGPMPQHYTLDPERMIREAWEQNFQVAKRTRWEGEDISWKELVAATARKSGEGSPLFALVEKQARPAIRHREEVTVYRTASGKIVSSPAQAYGEGFYPLVQTREVAVPTYLYTAWFFTRSGQPSGILAGRVPETSPCRERGSSGAQVLAVGKKSPAHTAGLSAGDCILSVNGHAVEYATLFTLLQPGRNTIIVCARNGGKETRELHLPTPLRK